MNKLVPFGLLYVTACGSDNVIDKQENKAPSIIIMSHGDGAEVQDGFVEYFRATVSDDDNEFDELSVAWYVGEDMVCDWEVASAAGESTCEIVFEEGDTNVIAEVRDLQGTGGRAELSIVVLPTEAPTVELLTPIEGENYYSDGLIQFSALVSDAEDAAEDLIIVWTSNVDGELSLDNSINASGEISDYTYLTEGNHAIELRVEDTTGKVSTDEVVIQVGGQNTEPMCSFTAPNDGDAFVVGESILFAGLATDDDISNTDLTVELSSNLDGVFQSLIPNSDGTFSFATNTLSHGTHTVTLSAMDEVGADCRTSLIVSVGNPPMATIDEPLGGTIYAVGETVTFRGTVTDSEDQPNQIAVEWNSDIEGMLQSGNANSQGVSQFTRSNLSAGVHSITLSATDTTGLVSDDLISFRVNTLPTVDSLTLSPDPVYSNNNLTATVSTSDADGQNVTASHAWYEDGTLTSFTGTTINDTELDVGENWTVRVTPNDGFQDGNYVEQSIVISNTDPTISSASISPNSNINVNSLLTCSATGSDLDDGALTPTYAWTSSGGATHTGATWQLSPNTVSGGETITCTASVIDNNGASISSNTSVTIDDTPPTSTGIAISPNSGVVTGTTLTCTGGFNDLEDGVLTPTYAWTVNGNPVSNTSTYTVTSTDTNVGDNLVCTTSATDSDGNMVTDSASVTVDNTTPTVNNISVTSSDNASYNTSIYTCSATVTDIDDNSSTAYAWTFGGSTLTLGTQLDAATQTLFPGDTFACEVQVTDGDTGTITTQTANVTVDNRTPSTPTATITWLGSGSIPTDADDLTCTGSGSTDPDGEIVSYTYTWTSSGGMNVSGDTVLASSISGSETWTCSAVATDGTASSSAGTDSVTVDSGCGLTDCDLNLDLGGGQSIDLVLIPNGTFTMGSTTNEVGRYSDEVQHQVTLTNDYYVMTTEVTQGMFGEIMGYQSHDGQSTSNSNGSYGIANDYPAYYVSWHMAADFANTVTQRHNTVNGSNLQECYACSGSGAGATCSVSVDPYQCNGYRMLTEAEWEYAARAGTTSAFWTSNGGGNLPSGYTSTTSTLTDGFDLLLYGHYFATRNNPYGTKEVAQLLPNDYGLYDMSGNVWEWTQDWYGAYSTGSVTNPTGISSASDRVLRGGSWNYLPNYLRSAERRGETPTIRYSSIGFRLALTPITQPSAASIAIANQSPTEQVDDLYCEILVDSIDPDGNSVTYTFDWTVDGSTYNGSTSTTMYTGDTIPASDTNAGEVWECTLTPNDGTEDGFTSTDSVTVTSACGLTNCDTNLDLGGGQSIDMVLIPSGSDPLGRYDITSDFYLMTTEVTQGMFTAMLSYDPSNYSYLRGVGNDYPVYYVNWHMAADFANKVTQRHNSVYGTNLQECYVCSNSDTTSVSCIAAMNPYQCDGYALPTEAEWEYAARSGTPYDIWTVDGGGNHTAHTCNSGETIQDGVTNPLLRDYGWFCGNNNNAYGPDGTKVVAQKIPNAFGLYDMYGNLREWIADQDICSFPDSNTDPYCGAFNSTRTIRGGCWTCGSNDLRASYSILYDAIYRTGYIGFRLGRHP